MIEDRKSNNKRVLNILLFLSPTFFFIINSAPRSSSFNLHQVLESCVEAEKLTNRYEALASDLLDWIEKTIAIISNQKFANSLTGVQQQLQAFTTYCTIEKPIKYDPFTCFTEINGSTAATFIPRDHLCGIQRRR